MHKVLVPGGAVQPCKSAWSRYNWAPGEAHAVSLANLPSSVARSRATNLRRWPVMRPPSVTDTSRWGVALGGGGGGGGGTRSGGYRWWYPVIPTPPLSRDYHGSAWRHTVGGGSRCRAVHARHPAEGARAAQASSPAVANSIPASAADWAGAPALGPGATGAGPRAPDGSGSKREKRNSVANGDATR